MITSNQGLILWLTVKTAHIGTVLCHNVLGVLAPAGFAVKSMTCKVASVCSGALEISPKLYCSPVLPKFCLVFSQTFFSPESHSISECLTFSNALVLQVWSQGSRDPSLCAWSCFSLSSPSLSSTQPFAPKHLFLKQG